MSKNSKKTASKKSGAESRSRTKRKIYPTHTGFGGSGRYYDATLVEWEDFLKKINELQGRKRMDFLESLFTYPPIPRVIGEKPYVHDSDEDFMSQDEKKEHLRKRGYELLDDFVVQNTPEFLETTFSSMKYLSSELIYPAFAVSFVTRERKPHRFNLRLIEEYGELVLFGDVSEQILFYKSLISLLEAKSDIDGKYSDEEDVLFMFNKSVRREENAVAQTVFKFVRAKYRFYREVQRQRVFVANNHESNSSERPTKNKGGKSRDTNRPNDDIKNPRCTPLEIFRGVKWASTEEAKTDLLGFLSPNYGELDNDSFFIYDSEKGIKNLYYILMILQRGHFFVPGAKDEDILVGIFIRDESGTLEKCKLESYRSGKKRLSGKSPVETPHGAIKEFMTQFLETYGWKGRKNVEEMT